MSGNDDSADDADAASDKEKSSPVSVRKAHLAGLDLEIKIAHADDSLIRSVGALALAGDLTYATDESTDGVLRGSARSVELGAVGVGRFSATAVRLESASDVEVEFHGLTPVRARVATTNLQLDGVHVAPRSGDDRNDVDRSTAAGGDHPHATHAKAK